MEKEICVIILAAGEGKRLGGETQKVVKKLLGKPMLLYLMDTVKKIPPEKIVVVVGHKKEEVFEQLKNEDVIYAEQKEPKGTGDAVLVTEPIFKNYSGNILILYGDMPFITLETINALFNTQIKNDAVCTILTGIVEDPTGYGRIIRDENGEVKAIVEELNATEEEKKIKEINCGIYIFKSEFLFPALKKLKPDPIKGEYYLTDVIKILKDEGRKISTYTTKLIEETIGINTPEDLKKAEKFLTKRRNKWTVV